MPCAQDEIHCKASIPASSGCSPARPVQMPRRDSEPKLKTALLRERFIVTDQGLEIALVRESTHEVRPTSNPSRRVYTYWMDSLSGTVERITFYNPENGYTVPRLRPGSAKGFFTKLLVIHLQTLYGIWGVERSATGCIARDRQIPRSNFPGLPLVSRMWNMRR